MKGEDLLKTETVEVKTIDRSIINDGDFVEVFYKDEDKFLMIKGFVGIPKDAEMFNILTHEGVMFSFQTNSPILYYNIRNIESYKVLYKKNDCYEVSKED